MPIIVTIIISVLFSAFFSGMEIAYVSSNKLKIELYRKERSFNSKIVSFLSRYPGQYIVTMLIGNNIALVIYGIFMVIKLEGFIPDFITSEPAILLIQTIISTLIILFVAEFLPKTLFRLSPNTALKLFAIPVYLFYIVLYPITRFTIIISNVIIRVITGTPVEEETAVFGKIDLDHLVSEVPLENIQQSETEHEIKIFQNALDFSNVKLRDCMVPRPEIVALNDDCQLEELTQRFIETGLSKILIYRESTDNIIGYINSKSLFRNPEEIKTLILNLPIVPETMPANKLMQLFIREHNSIAVVVDEFGGTSGIVTLEDLIEEIIGEIEDEHDVSELTENQISDNEYIFSGRHEIDYLNEKYGLGIPESDNYETLAGLILYYYESIPKINERIIIEPFTFRILDVGETRIELIQLARSDES